MARRSQRKVTIEEIASAILRTQGEDRPLRGMAMEFLRQNPDLSVVDRPCTNDRKILAAAASLLELFAQRRDQSAPSWTQEVEPLPDPIYLVEGAGPAMTEHLRRLADEKSPEPLRRRGFFAPPGILSFV